MKHPSLGETRRLLGQAMRDPAFGAAIMQCSSEYNQRLNQQILQQQQNFAIQNAENQRIRDQLQKLNAIQQSQGTPIYNHVTGTYQYVLPGWNYKWDDQHNTWVIQP
jgi:hypothetical protein